MMIPKPSEVKVVPTPREVIEKRLLSGIQDEGKVAILLGRQELLDLHEALSRSCIIVPPSLRPRIESFVADLQKLKEQAFGDE